MAEPPNLREIVFGFNDGLVSTFAFVAGLAGAGLTNPTILLVGLISALSAALSMGFGAWLSTKSENEAFHARLNDEEAAVRAHPETSKGIILTYLEGIGLNGTSRAAFAKRLVATPEHAAKFIVRTIHGLENSTIHQPLRDSLFMFFAFIAGAIFPLFSYAIGAPHPFTTSIILSFAAAFAIGAIKTVVTKKTWYISGAETLIIACVLVLVAYLSGMAIEGLLAVTLI